jgi:hypothetical protein
MQNSSNPATGTRNLAFIKPWTAYTTNGGEVNPDWLLIRQIRRQNFLINRVSAAYGDNGIIIYETVDANINGRLMGIAPGETEISQGSHKTPKTIRNLGIKITKFGNIIPIYTKDKTADQEADSDSFMEIGSDINSFYKGNFKKGTVQTSDKKEKTHIQFLSEDKDNLKDFFMSLKPTKYKWKDNEETPKVHFGFYAQDVFESAKDTLGDTNITSAVLKDEKEYNGELSIEEIESTDDEKIKWNMAYAELIAPCVQMIQQQQKEIEELKEMIKALQK